MQNSMSPDFTSCSTCGSWPSWAPGYWSISIVPLLSSFELVGEDVAGDAVAGVDRLVVGEPVVLRPGRLRLGAASRTAEITDADSASRRESVLT